MNSLRRIVVGLACTAVAAAALAGGLVTKLEARMRGGSNLAAKAAYVNEQNGTRSRQKFTVEVQGAQPGAAFGVTVNGNAIGVITADGLGRGKLDLVQGGDNPGQSAIPAMNAGDTVAVGAMSGTLASR